MASPNRKKVESSMKKVERSLSFSWDKEMTMVLLYLCVDFRTTHGPKQPYKWPKIAEKFEERTGKYAHVSTLRNRMEIMKKQHHLWTNLKGSATDNGWDPVTGKIEADSDWWDMKIKENSDVKRFRNDGVSPDMEDLWERLFGDFDAPGLDVSPLSTAIDVYEPQPHQHSPPEPVMEDYENSAVVLDSRDRGLQGQGGSATPNTPNNKLSSPRNKVASSIKKGERSISFSWDKASTMALLYLCADFQSTHGRKQPYKWPKITEQFEERTGKHAPVSTLRNKMEIMKRHYHLWTKLKGSGLGLRRNPLSGKIDADSAWWDMKIKENSEYKRFRNEGVSPDMEHLWERVFGDGVVEGLDILPVSTAPGLYEPRSHQHSLPEPVMEDDDLATGQGGSASPSTPSGSAPKLMLDMRASTTPVVSKRPRLSRGTAAVQDTVPELLPEGKNAVASISAAGTCATSSSPAPEDPDRPVRDAFAVLYHMVGDGLVERGSDMFCFATSKILDDTGRKGFMFLESDEDRLAWLRFEMRKR